jgi:nucleotide-binding universal stress UspA family protein
MHIGLKFAMDTKNNIMIKILVPTDFSINSRAGMRFAIHWSQVQKIELVFFHMFHQSVMPGNINYKEYLRKKECDSINKLQQFVSGLYNSMHCQPGKFSCVAVPGTSADISVMDYCRKHNDLDYICISTHGAGGINRLFGTNTGNLITKSPVPVIAVPKEYRSKQVRHVLYVTDLLDYSEELKKVEHFTRPFEANIEVVHLSWPGEILPGKEILEKSHLKNFPYGRELKIEKVDFTRSLIKNLQEVIYKSKPSLIIMFTDQHRNLIQKILFPSKAEQLSFKTKIPLLTFQKANLVAV